MFGRHASNISAAVRNGKPGPTSILLLAGCTFLCLAASALAASRLPASAPRSACEVRLTEHGVSARISGVSLQQALEATTRATGVRFVWLRDAGVEPVSVQFADVPLEDALGRILAERNFVLVLPAKAGAALPTRVVWVGSAVRPRAGTGAPKARNWPPPYPTDEDLQGGPPLAAAESEVF